MNIIFYTYIYNMYSQKQYIYMNMLINRKVTEIL